MAGTYWLTILPETSRLKEGIRRAVREAESGLTVTVTPKVDKSGAERAGREFGQRFTKSADAKVDPKVNSGGAERTGRDAGRRFKRGFEDEGEAHPHVDTDSAEAEGRLFGSRFRRGFTTSTIGLAAAIGGIGLGFKLAAGPARRLTQEAGKISLAAKGASIAASVLGSALVAGGTALRTVAGVSLQKLGGGLKVLGDQAGNLAKQVTRVTSAFVVLTTAVRFGAFMSTAAKWMGILTIGTVALVGALSALTFAAGTWLWSALVSVGSAMGVTAGVAVGLLAPALFTAKLAFAQLGDAAKDYLKKFEEADAAFTTMIGERMGPMLDAFRELRMSITDTFTRTLEPSFANLGNLMAGLQPQLTGMSLVLGQVGNELTASLSSPATMGAWQQMITASQQFFTRISSGLAGMTSGLVQFASTAADTFAGSWGDGINSAFTRFGDWLRSIGPAQMKLAFATLQQQIQNVMDVVVPIFNALRQIAAISAPALAPGFQAIGKAFSDATPAVMKMAEDLMPALGQALANLAPIIPTLIQVFTPWAQVLALIAPPLASIIVALTPFAPLILAGVLAVKAIVAGLAVYNTVMLAGTVATKAATAAGKMFNLTLLANPIGLIVAGIVALGVALWAFFTKTETGRRVWAAVWGGIKQVAGTVFEWLKAALQWVGDKMNWLWENVAQPVFKRIGEVIAQFWAGTQVVWEGLQTALQFVGDKMNWLWQNIAVPVFEGIKSAISAFWDGAKAVWDALTDAIDTVGEKISGLKGIFETAFNAIKDTVTRVWNSISGIFDSIKDAAGTVGSLLGGAAGVVVNTLGLDGNADGGRVGYASGGRISGPGSGTSDSILGVPAMVRVSNGEYIVNAESTAKYLPLLSAINAGALPGFAAGGLAVGKAPEAGLQGNTILLSRLLSHMFPQVGSIGGYRADNLPDHPSGLALDVMIPNPMSPTGIALGNTITAFLMKNADKLNVDYTIWRQTFRAADGRSNVMEDRGDPTQNHFDHVHVTTKPGGPGSYAPPKGLKLPGGGLGSSGMDGTGLGASLTSSAGGSLGGSISADGTSLTTYRAATDSELQASNARIDSATKTLREAEQRIDDKNTDLELARTKLSELQASGKAKQSQLDAAQNRIAKLEREIGDAETDAATAREKLAQVEQADSDLRTLGKEIKAKSSTVRFDDESSLAGGAAGAAGGGNDFSSLGQTFVGGIFESIGLDGGLFSNPLEWPSVKSLMAGVNFLGGLASIAGAPAEGTDAALAVGGSASSAGGFFAGAADAVGVESLMSAIPQPGSPVLSPGEINPAVPGATAAAPSPAGMSAFAPAQHGGTSGAAPGPVDNSININGPVGMDPSAMRTQMRAEQNARTRTTVMR